LTGAKSKQKGETDEMKGALKRLATVLWIKHRFWGKRTNGSTNALVAQAQAQPMIFHGFDTMVSTKGSAGDYLINEAYHDMQKE
jgi:hypothetical protein